MRFTIDIISNQFPDLSRGIQANVVRELNVALMNYESLAAPTTPFDTGHLLSNVRRDAATEGNPEATYRYLASYAVYVHEPTVRSAGQPWARTTAQRIQPEFTSRMRSVVEG